MNPEHEIEILLVEDNPYDAELTIRELTRRHLANKLVHVKDGVEALDVARAVSTNLAQLRVVSEGGPASC